MTLRIAKRFLPFSHVPGTACLIPGTELSVTGYPTLAIVRKNNEILFEYPLEKPTLFMIEQNLEQGFVKINNKYYIDASGALSLKKPPAYNPSAERLFLGCSKALNWDDIRSRKNLTEILPLWHRLSTYYHSEAPLTNPLETHLSFFNASFLPRASDTDHYGFNLPAPENPFSLLSTKALRSLFLIEEDKIIIPKPLFTCGRLINIPTTQGEISYEWTKNFPRQLLFKGDIQNLEITFPPTVTRYRVTRHSTHYLFDRFEG